MFLGTTSLLRRGLFVSQGSWEKEVENARGTMERGKRKERRLFPLPTVAHGLSIFPLLLLLGYPAGASGGGREWDDCNTQGKLKTKVMQTVWGASKLYYETCVNGDSPFSSKASLKGTRSADAHAH